MQQAKRPRIESRPPQDQRRYDDDRPPPPFPFFIFGR
jgi:hypothetical protein